MGKFLFWSSNIEDFNRFQVSNTETCLSIWIVPSSKSATSMTSMSFRVLDDLLCFIRGFVFSFLMQDEFQMTLRYCFHMLSLLLECTHTICFKHIHLRSAKCNLPSKPLPFLVCCSRIITAYISRCFMCDRYVCPFAIVYLLLAHLFSFTDLSPFPLFHFVTKDIPVLLFNENPQVIIIHPFASFCQPVKNKNSLNHWDPTELLRCESISIGTDDSNLITKLLKSDEIGGIKEND